MLSLQISGVALALAAGLSAGLCTAPIKFMKSYRYEHWALVYSIFGMIALPWLLAFWLCPDIMGALGQIPVAAYLKANACSLAWGVANVLCCLCLIRIGFSLTMGIITGVGLPIGIMLPLVLKGSGQFADAPSPFSAAGLAMAIMAAVLALSVAMMAYAGFRRERTQGANGKSGGFGLGLAMSVAAGILQVGLSFAFVYSQGPLMDALQAKGASESGAIAAVWATTLPGGALANIFLPLALLFKRGGFKELLSARDFALSLLMGLLFASLVLCMGNGMRMLGALGASLGFGLYQGFQTLSSQGVGIFSGEWRGADLKTKTIMSIAVLLTLFGVAGMALAKSL